MSRGTRIVAALAAVVVLGVAYYLASPLFINRTVDEAFDLPTAAEAAAMPADELVATLDDAMSRVDGLDADARAAVQAQVEELAALMPDKSAEDAMPDGAPAVLAGGAFVGADSFHQGSGTATLYALPDGSRVLRLADFEVTNGPDLHVVLSTHPNPVDRGDIGDYVDLGSLKGNRGNQNYAVSAEIDLSRYQSVVIYCEPFQVVFAVAGLTP